MEGTGKAEKEVCKQDVHTSEKYTNVNQMTAENILKAPTARHEEPGHTPRKER